MQGLNKCRSFQVKVWVDTVLLSEELLGGSFSGQAAESYVVAAILALSRLNSQASRVPESIQAGGAAH